MWWHLRWRRWRGWGARRLSPPHLSRHSCIWHFLWMVLMLGVTPAVASKATNALRTQDVEHAMEELGDIAGVLQVQDMRARGLGDMRARGLEGIVRVLPVGLV